MKHRWLIPLIALMATIFITWSQAQAGYVEISATGSYRQSTIDEFNKSFTQSGTGAFAFYFWEQSAIELSYTKGVSKTFGRISAGLDYVTTVNFITTGADFILSFGGKEAAFRPYFKVGAIQAQVEQIYEQTGTSPTTQKLEGTGPSAGAGFRILISDHFAFKAGFDTWQSPTKQNPPQYDFAGNAGISLIF